MPITKIDLPGGYKNGLGGSPADLVLPSGNISSGVSREVSWEQHPYLTAEEIEKLKELVKQATPVAAPIDTLIEPLTPPPVEPVAPPPRVETKDVTPERTVTALLKHPKLAYEVAQLLNGAKLAGPWEPGISLSISARCSTSKMLVACILKNPDGTYSPTVMVERTTASGDLLKFQTVTEAQEWADKWLLEHGYIFCGG